MNNSITISRQELYNQVWSKPLIHLAKDYLLSDVGLAKICRRHNIPLPPPGYWVKLSHNHNVKKIPLPLLKPGEIDDIEIVSKYPSPFQDMDLNGTPTDPVTNAIGHSFITVNEFKRELHPLVLESQKEFRDRLKGYKNVNEGERFYVHNIAVTKSSFDRALSLMNMLFQVLELNDLSISRKPGYGGGTYVKINGRDVQIALKERTKRTENQDPKSFSKYEFHPTGILHFDIENVYVDGVRKTWNDTQSRKLEEVLNEVGIGIIIAAILDKKRNQEREAIFKKEEAEREKQRLKEEQQREEREKIKALLEDSRKWQASNILRGYIKAIEDKHTSVTITEEEKSDLRGWIKWAKETADIIDPAVNQSWKKNSV